MSYVKDLIYNVIQEYLSRPSVLAHLTDALAPLIHEKAISYLNRGFDIHVLDVLRPKVGLKEKYVLYESTKPATLWFLIDLSDAREGDKFYIDLHIRLSNGDFLPRDHWEIERQQRRRGDQVAAGGFGESPMVTLSEQFAPACRLTLSQVNGASREVRYEVFGRYEER
jgi:hypothetical protein